MGPGDRGWGTSVSTSPGNSTGLPVVRNRYAIYRTDIEPTGIRPLLFDGFLTDRTIEEVRRVLSDGAYRHEMVEHNYRVAEEFFDYHAVREELELSVQRPLNIYRLLGRRGG